jgi:hypothetical protein
VDLRAGLDDLEKRKFSTLPGLELRPPFVQPVASRYTDYAQGITEDNYIFKMVISMPSASQL